MRKIIYLMSVSLDGYMEGPGGDLSWTVPDEELHQHFNDLEKTNDMHLYGRRLYELMSAAWPTADQDPAAPEVIKQYARIWRTKPKLVFSRTLKHVEWNSRLAGPDLVEEVRRLKEQPGRNLSVGGAGLAHSFMQLGLIDEYWLYLRPVILGGGKRMFGPLEVPISLRLLETRKFNQGVLMMRYEAT